MGQADISGDAAVQGGQLAPPADKNTSNASGFGQTQVPEWPKLTVDHAWRIPDVGVFLIGWCLDPLGELETVSAGTGEHGPLTLSDIWIRIRRDDVVKAYPNHADPSAAPGFIALLRGSSLPDTLTLNVSTASGGMTQVMVPAGAIESYKWFVRAVLGSYPLDHPSLKDIVCKHVGPAISGAYRKVLIPTCEVVDTQFGRPPNTPTVSMIIPLYGRADFMRYQLALMADDPDLDRVEIVYVVDDPRVYAEAVHIADALCDLLAVAARVVTSGRNLGYAGANNLGASVARGQVLLLVNSDVMPTHRGWITAVVDALDTLPEAGVVGTQLRYEDGSLQFVGMHSRPYRKWGGLPINVHPSKGFAPETLTTESPLECQSVTGAVLAIRKSVFDGLGGMDEAFLFGDFEDSALCSLVRKRGLRCFVIPWCGVYHLERLSQGLIGDSGFRTKVTLVNSWRYETEYQGQSGNSL